MAAVCKLRNLVTGVPHLLLPGVHLAGRSEEADIQLADESISRRHARIHNTDAGLMVEDLGSSNGTFVQGRRIEGAVRVGLGEEIRLGAVRFRLDPEVGVAGGAGERLASEQPPPLEAFRRRTNKITAEELDAAKVKKITARQVPETPQQVGMGGAAKYPGSSLLREPAPAASAASAPAAPVAEQRPVWRYFLAGVLVGAVAGAVVTVLLLA